MRDAVFVAVTVAFFAIAALYVRACARILGPDEPVVAALEPSHADKPETGSLASGREAVAP
jgi:hypothetical protein